MSDGNAILTCFESFSNCSWLLLTNIEDANAGSACTEGIYAKGVYIRDISIGVACVSSAGAIKCLGMHL